MSENRPATESISLIDIEEAFPKDATLSRLYKFYGVKTVGALITDMACHIEQLQKKLATKDSYTRTFGVRQG